MQTSLLTTVDYTLLSSLVQEIETNPTCLAKIINKIISDPLFLFPIPAKRNICLFTLSLHYRRGDLSKWIFDRLATAHLLEQLVQQKDLGGWTPVHHAAIHHNELYKRLKRVPAAAVLKSPYSTSPTMLRKITLLSKNCLLEHDYSIYVRLPGRMEENYLCSSGVIQSAGLFQDPPHYFSPICHMSVKTIHEFWKRNSKAIDPESKSFVRYNEYLTHMHEVESQLALRLVERDDEGKEPPLRVGLGVVARKAIRAGTVIGNYGGWVQERSIFLKHRSAYCLAHSKGYIADGREYRSFGSTFNHSFPNARFKGCMINGNDETLIMTITPIEAEEEICVSYGDEYKFPDIVVELRPKAMERFVKEHPLNELTSLLFRKRGKSLNEEEKNIYIQWLYILQDVPTRFLQLILKEHIPPDHVKPFLTHFGNSFDIESNGVKLCMELAKTNPQQAQELARRLTKRMYTAVELQVIMSKKDDQAKN
jgi:hypothetical protein